MPRRKLNQSLKPSSGSKNIDIICTCLDGLDGRTGEETLRCCATSPARRTDRVPGGPRLANRRASRSLRTSRCDGFKAALDCNHKFLHFRKYAVGHTNHTPSPAPRVEKPEVGTRAHIKPGLNYTRPYAPYGPLTSPCQTQNGKEPESMNNKQHMSETHPTAYANQ